MTSASASAFWARGTERIVQASKPRQRRERLLRAAAFIVGVLDLVLAVDLLGDQLGVVDDLDLVWRRARGRARGRAAARGTRRRCWWCGRGTSVASSTTSTRRGDPTRPRPPRPDPGCPARHRRRGRRPSPARQRHGSSGGNSPGTRGAAPVADLAAVGRRRSAWPSRRSDLRRSMMTSTCGVVGVVRRRAGRRARGASSSGTTQKIMRRSERARPASRRACKRPPSSAAALAVWSIGSSSESSEPCATTRTPAASLPRSTSKRYQRQLPRDDDRHDAALGARRPRADDRRAERAGDAGDPSRMLRRRVEQLQRACDLQVGVGRHATHGARLVERVVGRLGGVDLGSRSGARLGRRRVAGSRADGLGSSSRTSSSAG